MSTLPNQAILPGATLGVLGGGQLGRMFTQAAQQMGYRVHVLAPDSDSPGAQVSHETVTADYLDLDRVADFARRVDVITFEFENVPATTVETAARYAPVRPAGSLLHTTQNRLREKTALQRIGIPVTPFEPVRSRIELGAALDRIGAPAILKTATWGYDGKGQRRIQSAVDADAAWGELGPDTCVLERAIDFECEISVVIARGLSGEMTHFDPIENVHQNHILDVSICPARIAKHLQQQAREMACEVMQAFDVVGVLCVEFFVAPGPVLMVNELAPRPHNSGHLTLDASVTSQFAQQVRAVCGLPLGEARLHRPAAMANLLGDLWRDGSPHWDRALAVPEVKLHLYGKEHARRGRKMGHLTALAPTVDEALSRVCRARESLSGTERQGHLAPEALPDDCREDLARTPS